MQIYALISPGEYGRRIIRNIERHKSSDWEITAHEFSEPLPTVIDTPEEYVPKDTPSCELILSLSENPSVASLLPAIAEKTGAKALIVAVDSPSWVPPGLQRQIERELAQIGVASAFPKPLCALTETGNQWIDAFAKIFGKPALEIIGNEVIEKVTVKRGAPCGSTWHIAEKLKGVKTVEAEHIAGLLLHDYPCLASMQIDKTVEDTIMHLSGYIIKDAVKEAKNKSQKRKPLER